MVLDQPVVVLGGGGFIGANLVHRLQADGHDVRAVDVDFPEWRHIPPGVQLHADLTDPYQTINACADAGTVFHLAADMGGVGYFHSDADLGASMVNGQITLNVAQAVTRLGTPRVFYASSACAYPVEEMEAGATLTEDRVGMGTPDALYGAEKLHGLRLMGKVENARVGIFDTIYGPLQEHDGRRMKFPAAVATKALAARDSGRLELWGDGSQRRTYCYIDDAVEQILRIVSADTYHGPVNVGAAEVVSCREIADMCLALVGAADAEVVLNPDGPTGVSARACSREKFEALYGLVEHRSYREGFGLFLDWLDAL